MIYENLNKTIVVRIPTSTYLAILHSKKYGQTVSDYVRDAIKISLMLKDN